MYVPKIAELRRMSDAELIRRHDALENVQDSVNYYLQELARREQRRQTETMLRLTWAIAVFTAIVTAATIANFALDLVRR